MKAGCVICGRGMGMNPGFYIWICVILAVIGVALMIYWRRSTRK